MLGLGLEMSRELRGIALSMPWPMKVILMFSSAIASDLSKFKLLWSESSRDVRSRPIGNKEWG